MTTKIPCIGYARISTNRSIQVDTLDIQKQAITNYANSNNYQLERIFEEKDSGAHHDRKCLQEIFAHLKKNQNNNKIYILVTRLDRLCRTKAVFGSILCNLKKFNCTIVAIDMPNASIEKMWDVVTKIEIGYNNNKKCTKEEVLEKQKNGYFHGHEPYGYKYKEVGLEYKILTKARGQAIRVNNTYKMFVDTKKYYPIMASIFKNKKDIKGIKDILKNCVYAGIVSYKDPDTCEQKYVRGKHEAIVTKRMFAQAASVIADIKHKSDSVKGKTSQATKTSVLSFLSSEDRHDTLNYSLLSYYHQMNLSGRFTRILNDVFVEMSYGNVDLSRPAEDLYLLIVEPHLMQLSKMVKELYKEHRVLIKEIYHDCHLYEIKDIPADMILDIFSYDRYFAEKAAAALYDLKVLRYLLRLTLDIFICHTVSSVQVLAELLTKKEAKDTNQSQYSNHDNLQTLINSEIYNKYFKRLEEKRNSLVFDESDLGQLYTHLLLLGNSSYEDIYNDLIISSGEVFDKEFLRKLNKLERMLNVSHYGVAPIFPKEVPIKKKSRKSE